MAVPQVSGIDSASELAHLGISDGSETERVCQGERIGGVSVAGGLPQGSWWEAASGSMVRKLAVVES